MDIVNGDGLELFLSSLELKKVSFLFIKKKFLYMLSWDQPEKVSFNSSMIRTCRNNNYERG